MSYINESNVELNIICTECSCIPLLGLNFDYENKNISESIELHSYCIFKHQNNSNVRKNLLEKAFSNEIKKPNLFIKCECCKEKRSEYYCLNCKINICNLCFK